MKPKTVVVYFSATGTTERVAKMISIATGGKLHEIQPEKKYSAADLDWTVKTSRCCREKDDPESRPAILKNNEDINNYDIIYLGYPIWWNMAPRIINSFIESCNLEGKTVISFCTSGGSGIDNSVRLLKNYYPDANWRAGKILNGNTQREIDEWISCK
ncbi:MAG: flavodoxin [Bacteroidales bacterium]|nr:flavodoxin [Bacteroidales bacterium]